MQMPTWEWSLPTKIIFGAGTRGRLPEFLEGKRAALVRSKSVGDVPGSFIGEFSGIRPNPTKQNVADCAAFIRDTQAEIVVALGGGSVLDCAKAAADGMPLVAMPTTSGTGSEVTSVCVLSDEDAGTKFSIASPDFYPSIAIVDSELTYTVPRKVAAESGLDALAHAMEALWSIRGNPASTAIALRAVRLVLDDLEHACEGGSAARDNMSLASLLAGMAFSQSKTAGCHACANPLTVGYGLSHGESCAFTLAAFTRINNMDRHAKALEFENASALADKIDGMKAALGLPLTLAQAGIPQEDLPKLAEACLLPPNMRNNPVTMDRASMLALFESLG